VHVTFVITLSKDTRSKQYVTSSQYDWVTYKLVSCESHYFHYLPKRKIGYENWTIIKSCIANKFGFIALL